jgi:hypothetical protein
MTSQSLWAVVLAPILGPLIWWGLKAPGRAVHDFLWRRLPDGRLRRMLLRKVQ